MSMQMNKSASIAAPDRTMPAIAAVLAAIVMMVLYRYFHFDQALYQWSKTFASYDYRQHLGMSKRYLLQYGYGLGLFVLLVAARYLCTSDRTSRASPLLQLGGRYCVAVFCIHLPTAFFVAAVFRTDASDPVQGIALTVAALGFSIMVGAVAFTYIKPEFDRWAARWLDKPVPAPGGDARARHRIPRSLSDAMHGTRIVATASVMFNHLQHFSLVGIFLPTIGRASMPLFLMMAGYFAMLGIRRSRDSVWRFVARRYYGLWFILVPSILITTAFGSLGYALRPEIYSDKHVVIASAPQFLVETLKTLTYLGEVWTGIGAQGFAGNEALWTIFYIMPFTAMLAAAVMISGWWRWLAVAGVAAVCGPPMLMLAPLFFAGALAYRIHENIAD
jgi:hypothetical protein